MNVILLDNITNQAVIDMPATVNHIKTVLKSKAGDSLKIGEIGGKIGTGQITQITNVVHLANCVLDKSPPAKLDLTVVLALPRPKVLRRLIIDMTAMGVGRIVIINTARSDKSYWSSPKLAMIDEFILEGLTQGVDTIKPCVSFAKRFRPFVEDELSNIVGDKWVLHPYADSTPTKDNLPKVVLIGAEGGFVPFEIDLLKNIGVKAVAFGDRILRTEAVINSFLGWYAF